MATLTLRNTKGSALTFDELDSNFQALDSDITTINNTFSSGVGLGADSVNSLIDARIDSDDFVDLTTVQTITGAKTFNGGITVSSGLIANSLTYPTADGNTGEFLKTDGAGNLTFDAVTASSSYDSAKVQGQIDSDFGTRTTAELTELTNLYYTDARARAAISVIGDLSYNSGTGVISYTDSAQHTSSEIRGMFSGSGDISYNSTTGDIGVTTYKTADFTTDFAAESIFNLSDVTSGTVVTNLNADKVDGFNGIAVYDRNGTILN